MFRELVELGQELERAGELPPPGFYYYRDPIRWIAHLYPDRVVLEGAELVLPRPYSGRTSGEESHLLVDEAGYVFNIQKKDDGSIDRNARKKHDLFRKLIEGFAASPHLRDEALRQALEWLISGYDRNLVALDPHYSSLTNKQWVTLMPEQGPLQGSHLFQHPDVKAFWREEMQRRTATVDNALGTPTPSAECAVCGLPAAGLVRKLPLKVKLTKSVPLHSLNQDAFTSFIGGGSTQKKTHIGLCFGCGDTAARAFNFLTSSDRHHRTLVAIPRKPDVLGNQIALFWLKAPAPLRIAEELIDPSALLALPLDAPLAEVPTAPPTALSQLLNLLQLPWRPDDASLRLDTYAFYLAVLSPNVGRIAVREWMPISLDRLKNSLATFLQASQIVDPWGAQPRPISIRAIVEALGTGEPNLTRALLRSAYLGSPLPAVFHGQAGQRLNAIIPFEHLLRERQRSRSREKKRVWDDRWPQTLAAAVKLGLVFGTGKEATMTDLDPLLESKGYQCGRLLAVLEEAQQVYSYKKNRRRLETTIVNRSYGGASIAPQSAFVPLLRLATTAHLPDAGGQINRDVEEITSTLVKLGGWPRTLSLPEQAEFGLGFYHQRAHLRARRDRPRGAGNSESTPAAG